MGMQQKAKEGKWTVSIPPLGYDSIESKLIINQQEAAIVKEIYSLYLSGMGMWKIARNLNEKGILSKKGKQWGQNPIRFIFTNPIYKGTTRYNFRVNKGNYFEVDEVAPAIISREDFKV